MSKNDITGDSLRSRELSPEGKANWDLIFGKKPVVDHEAFVRWVEDEYQGLERTEALNRYFQSGEYPEDFLVEWEHRCRRCDGRGFVDAGIYKTVHTHYSVCIACKGKGKAP